MNVLSLGAGVQSSALLLMCYEGEITPLPTHAVFADTQSEPRAVYDYLKYLEETVADKITVQTVTQGSLKDDFLGAVEGRNKRYSQPPFYVINRAGDGKHTARDTGGMLWRNCTQDFKLAPLRRATRALMQEHGAKHIHQMIGISLDEAHRMKPSGVKYITNVYPLVERRITRHDCLIWLKKHGYQMPVKSSCTFCPYRSNAGWVRFREEQPDDFADAVEVDRKLREGRLPGVTGTPYVHRMMIPLEEAVAKSAYTDQLSFEIDDPAFGNECEGMCGV